MASITFRPARFADLPLIVRLIHEDTAIESIDTPEDAQAKPYRAAFEAIDTDPNQALVIAEADGEAAGVFQVTYTPGLAGRGMWRATVESVHVRPELRNRGIGKTMMDEAVSMARARGCGVVQLSSNKKRVDAHRFYERLGFARSHEGFKLYL